MSSDPRVPATWRLTTSGGIPYRFVDIQGEFSWEPEAEPSATATWTAIIPAAQLENFVAEMLPDSELVGAIVIQKYKPLPGLPSLVAKRIRWRNHMDGKPVDPFVSDLLAPIGTYHHLVIVDVEFGLVNYDTPDQDDPITFVQLSAQSSGQFLHSPAPKAKWDPGGGAPLVPVTEQISPLTIVVPQTEWTARYPRMPLSYWEGTFKPRLDTAQGKVNDSAFELLFDAEAETVLLDGYTFEMEAALTSGSAEPFVNCDMKFQQKRIDDNGTVVGHNHFWRPGHGWQVLLVDGVGKKAYESTDFNDIFLVV